MDVGLIDEAIALVRATARKLTSEGPLTIAEHGSVSGQPKGACITHAHWHLLPGIIDLRHQLDDLGKGIEIPMLRGLPAATDGTMPYYLLASAGRITVHVIDERHEGHESQRIRRLVAERSGLKPGYHDWSLFQDREKFRATMELFLGA